jgi:membrane-bound ClpP family serine protease
MVELVPAKRLLSTLTGMVMAVIGLYILMVETSMYHTSSVPLFGAAVFLAGLVVILQERRRVR